MNVSLKSTVLVSLLLLIVSSCSYEFEDDYYQELNVREPNFNVVLSGFTDGDEISSSRIIDYQISGVDGSNFEMVVAIDGNEIFRSSDNFGEFPLIVDDLSDGNHSLTIDFATPTNSRSLADSVGAEFFFGQSQYSFVLDKTLAGSFGIESVKIVEGSIVIKLNPIVDDNFDEAFLMIRNDFGGVGEGIPITQDELESLVILDKETVMYNPSYAIKIKNSFEETTSEFVQLPTPEMEFKFEALAFRKFKLTYNEHPLYANMDFIRFNYLYPFSGSRLHYIEPQGGETIVDFSFRFGNPILENFKIWRNDRLVGNLYPQIIVGEKFEPAFFEDIQYIENIDKYILLDVQNNRDLIIHHLNSQTLEIEKSKTITTLGFSGDFNSLEIDPVTNQLYLNLREKAYIIDASSLAIMESFNAIDYNPNKRLANIYYRKDYIILEDGYSSGQVWIYDKATRELRYNIVKNTKFFSAMDASYFYANGDLFKQQSGDFVKVRKIRDTRDNVDAPPVEVMAFGLENNAAVLGWDRLTYYIGLDDNSQKRISGPEETYEVMFTDNGKVFINSSHFSAGIKCHLYDPMNEESRIINAFAPANYRYANGTIFAPAGYSLKTNLYIDL